MGRIVIDLQEIADAAAARAVELMAERIGDMVEDAVRRALDGSSSSGDYLTAAQVASMLTLSTVTLEQWRKHGEGPPWTQLGRRIAYPRTGLETWLAANRRGPFLAAADR